MQEDLITLKVKTLCNDIASSVNSAILHTDNYINSFTRTDFYTFSEIESKLKQHKKDYSDFLAFIAEPLKVLETKIAEASSLLIEADRTMNIEMIEFLQALFEEYLSFEKTLSEYNVKVKVIFENTNFSISALIEQAKKIKFSLLSLLSKTK